MARGHDVYVLSEFSLAYAPLAGLVARLNRAVLVVDAFVGRYETEVEDGGRAEAGSCQARRHRAIDAAAARTADLVVIDTEMRAERLRGDRIEVMSLPVGAPAWASPTPSPDRPDGSPLRLLYYGNFIALHGLDVVVLALERACRAGTRAEILFVGDGRERERIERSVRKAGLGALATFRDPVPEREIADLIADHDVVLGIFGESPKARSVIANKVWQGLASARTVVTRASPALDEIREAAGVWLVTVDGDSEEDLADHLADALMRRSRERPGPDPAVAARLEAVVEERFDDFHRRLSELVAR